jgi:opacity protein-like surface antigen
MTKHIFAAVAAVTLMSGVASAQSYPPFPPPAPVPVAPPVVVPAPPAAAAPAPPSVGVPGSTTTTTTVSPTTDHTTTITKGVDANGNEVTKKETYREGVAGSTVKHKETATDPDGGTTTRSTTTTTTHE